MTWSRTCARSNSGGVTGPRRPLLASGLALSLAVLPACERLEREPQPPALGAPKVQGPVGPLPGVEDEDTVQNPYAKDPSALADGRRYFVAMNCAGCHGDHAGGGMGPSLRDEVWIYGGSQGDIYDSISQGRANGMPSWGSMLPADLIWRIAAYIGSLRSPQEPSPPR